MAFKKPESASTSPRQPNSWELQDREIERLVKSFMEGYRYSPVYSDAQKGGYDWHLWSYVYHVSTIQAQMITGAKVGYDSTTTGITDKAEANRFLEEQRTLTSYGTIDVRVPSKLIEKWKNACTKNTVHPSSLTRTSKATF